VSFHSANGSAGHGFVVSGFLPPDAECALG
jgi:hypothetical protein